MDNWFGLYYPHVNLRDDIWLKTVALYWDRLYRLSNEFAEDSIPEIAVAQIELTGEGFLRSFSPSRESIRAAAGEFIQALDSELSQEVSSPIAGRDDYRYAFPATLARWKVDPELVELLTEMKWARSVHGDRIEMKNALVRAYLLLLGRQNASQLGAVPITDSLDDQATVTLAASRIISGFTGRATNEINESEAASVLINLAINTVLPRDIAAVPVSAIINFRWKYASERMRFRESVLGFLNESSQLHDVSSYSVLVDHLQARFDRQIAPALKDLERAMRGQRIDTVLGVANIQVAAPTAVAGSLALLATQPSIVTAAAIGAGGFGLSVWKSASEYRKQRAASLASSPISFLYHIQDLGVASLADTARRRFMRFGPR